jgi:predicted nucleic acid-binding protein
MPLVRTAVDSSVLLDLFSASSKFGVASREALDRALSEGALVACEVVWAEVRAHFPDRSTFESAMADLGLEFDAIDAGTAGAAGEAWRKYRREGGLRTVLVPDFLVGAHGATRAERLLTRNRGFARRYFPRLVILDPSRAAR